MKYVVTFSLRGCYKTSVWKGEGSPEDIEDRAEDTFLSADFGEADEIEIIGTSIDEDGDFVSVTQKFSAKYVACVDAKDPEAAEDSADELYMEADFGEAEDIDGEIIQTVAA